MLSFFITNIWQITLHFNFFCLGRTFLRKRWVRLRKMWVHSYWFNRSSSISQTKPSMRYLRYRIHSHYKTGPTAPQELELAALTVKQVLKSAKQPHIPQSLKLRELSLCSQAIACVSLTWVFTSPSLLYIILMSMSIKLDLWQSKCAPGHLPPYAAGPQAHSHLPPHSRRRTVTHQGWHGTLPQHLWNHTSGCVVR